MISRRHFLPGLAWKIPKYGETQATQVKRRSNTGHTGQNGPKATKSGLKSLKFQIGFLRGPSSFRSKNVHWVGPKILEYWKHRRHRPNTGQTQETQGKMDQFGPNPALNSSIPRSDLPAGYPVFAQIYPLGSPGNPGIWVNTGDTGQTQETQGKMA